MGMGERKGGNAWLPETLNLQVNTENEKHVEIKKLEL